jgi:hypothetical protein
VEALKQGLSLAEATHKQLSKELREFLQKIEADTLLEKLNLRWPGEEGSSEAPPAKLPAGPA